VDDTGEICWYEWSNWHDVYEQDTRHRSECAGNAAKRVCEEEGGRGTRRVYRWAGSEGVRLTDDAGRDARRELGRVYGLGIGRPKT
jgi:hypothetical protein